MKLRRLWPEVNHPPFLLWLVSLCLSQDLRSELIFQVTGSTLVEFIFLFIIEEAEPEDQASRLLTSMSLLSIR